MELFYGDIPADGALRRPVGPDGHGPPCVGRQQVDDAARLIGDGVPLVFLEVGVTVGSPVLPRQMDAYELGEHILIPLIGRVENQGIGGEGIHRQLHQLKAVRDLPGGNGPRQPAVAERLLEGGVFLGLLRQADIVHVRLAGLGRGELNDLIRPLCQAPPQVESAGGGHKVAQGTSSATEEADCYHGSSTTVTCATCNATISNTPAGDRLPPVYDGQPWVVEGDQEVQNCRNCDGNAEGHQNYRPCTHADEHLTKTGHEDGNCVTEGQDVYTCDCGATVKKSTGVVADAHDYTHEATGARDDGETHSWPCTRDANHTRSEGFAHTYDAWQFTNWQDVTDADGVVRYQIRTATHKCTACEHPETATWDNLLDGLKEEDLKKDKDQVTVTVKYVDEDGISIADVQTNRLFPGAEYTVTADEITGYTFKEADKDMSGTIGEEGIEITLTYARNYSLTVVHRYGEVEETVTDETVYHTGDAYTTASVAREGYELTETPENANGTFEAADVTVTYVYAPIGYSLTVNHLYGDELVEGEPSAPTYHIGDEYVTEPVARDGYELSVTPENAEGVFGTDNVIVTYEYAPIDYQLTVIHRYVSLTGAVEETTVTSETIYHIGDEYATSPIAREGYTLSSAPENASGTFGADNVTVT